jgi:hypothetical protein
MNIKRNWGIVRHSVVALTFSLALVGTTVAGASAVAPLAGYTPIPPASQTMDAWRKNRSLDNSVLPGLGSDPRYSAKLTPSLLLPVNGNVEATNNPARTSMSPLETSTKWSSNSRNIAGSRTWSKLIVFTSTSINVRLPIN